MKNTKNYELKSTKNYTLNGSLDDDCEKVLIIIVYKKWKNSTMNK